MYGKIHTYYISNRIFGFIILFMDFELSFFVFIQNEEERDESEEKDKDIEPQITSKNNSKFDMNDTIGDKQIKTIDQNNRPSNLPTSNHIITSPTNSNSNAVWNTDTWADGEFEPIEQNSSKPNSS